MRKLIWEMKSPTGKTLRPIERIMHRAAKQSTNIIFDCRRTTLKDVELVKALEKYFYEIRSIRNLWIITKKAEIIKYKKIGLLKVIKRANIRVSRASSCALLEA